MADGEYRVQPDERPEGGRSRKKMRKRGRRPLARLLGLALLTVVIAVGGAIGYVYIQADGMLHAMSNGGLPAADDGHNAGKEPTAMLLLGLDSRERGGTLNSDVIMVAAFHPQTGRATVVSLPRDAPMKPDGYRERKANAFYSVAYRSDKQQYGAMVKQWFGDYFGIRIDYMTVVDFRAFEEVIDAMGGLWLDVDMDMCYIDNADGTNISLTAGYQQLTGKQALDFVRYRHSTNKCAKRTAESGDAERNERQQQVVAAVLDNMISWKGLLSVGRVFDAAGANVATDMPPAQAKKFMLANAMLRSGGIEFITLTGQWRSPYVVIGKDQLADARARLQATLAGER